MKNFKKTLIIFLNLSFVFANSGFVFAAEEANFFNSVQIRDESQSVNLQEVKLQEKVELQPIEIKGINP